MEQPALTLPVDDSDLPAARRVPLTLPGLASLFLAALFALPILVVVGEGASLQGETFAHLASTVLPDYVRNTLLLVAGVGGGVIVLGVGTAWLTVMCRFPGRKLFEWGLILPLATPAYVMAYAYTDFLQFAGPAQTLLRELTGWQAGDYHFPDIRSLPGAIGVISLVLYPYVYLLTRAAFLEQPASVTEVCRSLGHGPWRAFWHVSLPLARPAVAAGTALALMETLADFGTVQYFGVATFTTGIYRAWFSMGDHTAAAQLSACLLGFVLATVLLERYSRGRARYHHASHRALRRSGYVLSGWGALGASLACALPIVLGFLLPAGILLNLSLEQGDAQFGSRYLELIANSATLAGVTALLAVVLGLLAAYGARLSPGRLVRVANRVAGMGYAVPGIIIAVGVLVPVARLDNAVDAFMRQHFGIATGLLLTGGVAALVYAYLVRFFSVSLQTLEAGLAKITASMDHAARSLGLGPGGTLLRVHAPLMRRSLLTAALMVFVDVMKELPATLVMRPFNFDTLAVQAYNLASDERLAEASTAALTIVVVGLLPLVILSRTIAQGRTGA